PQLDAFRKPEVSSTGSSDSQSYRPLHITSFLSPPIVPKAGGTPGSSRLREVGAGVDRAAVDDRHEVQVRAGRPPGQALVGDDLAGVHELPDLDDRRVDTVVEVAVERREVVAVGDDHDGRGVARREV